MTPAGWILVPLIPSEKMLDEFSEVAWPDRHELGPIWREKRALEAAAYSAMLKAAPAAPGGNTDEIEALKRQIKKLETHVFMKNKSIKILTAKLWQAKQVNP